MALLPLLLLHMIRLPLVWRFDSIFPFFYSASKRRITSGSPFIINGNNIFPTREQKKSETELNFAIHRFITIMEQMLQMRLLHCKSWDFCVIFVRSCVAFFFSIFFCSFFHSFFPLFDSFFFINAHVIDLFWLWKAFFMCAWFVCVCFLPVTSTIEFARCNGPNFSRPI